MTNMILKMIQKQSYRWSKCIAVCMVILILSIIGTSFASVASVSLLHFFFFSVLISSWFHNSTCSHHCEVSKASLLFRRFYFAFEMHLWCLFLTVHVNNRSIIKLTSNWYFYSILRFQWLTKKLLREQLAPLQRHLVQRLK